MKTNNALPHPLGHYMQGVWNHRKREYNTTRTRVGKRLAEILNAKEWRGFEWQVCEFWIAPYQAASVFLQERLREEKITGILITRKAPNSSAEFRVRVPEGVLPHVYMRAVLELVRHTKHSEKK